jgi:hypothetical protein
MSLPLQQILVGVLVAACALFSAWRLATVPLRLRALDALVALPGVQWLPWLTRLRQRTLARRTAACGGCGSKPGASSRNQRPGALRR